MNIRRQRFTIIELLTVVVIIMILGSIIFGGAKFVFDKSSQAAIKMEMKTLEMALEEYKKDWGYYPVWTDKKELDGSGTGSSGGMTITVSNRSLADGEFVKDTAYSTSFTTPLYGIIKGDGTLNYKASGWVMNFELEDKGGTPYLGARSTEPFLQTGGDRAVRYRFPGVKNPEKYDLIFPGPDEKFGTEDDINNWMEQ